MKVPITPFSLAALAAAMLSGCVTTSTVESRIAARPELYIDLPAEHRSLVDRGQIKEGMSKDAVFLAWGAPDGMRESSSNGRRTEVWLYETYDPVYTQHVDVGYGYGYGGWGHGYSRSRLRGGHGYYDCYPYDSIGIGTEVSYVPRVSRTVKFRNDKVTAWERVK